MRRMFDAIAPRYDLVNRIMTFRLDVRWRRLAVRSLALRPGSTVLDLACGTGDLCRELEAAGPRSASTSASGCWPRPAPPPRCWRATRSACPCPTPPRRGDLRVALRNFVELPPFLAELARALRPGGRIALLEVDTPANPVLRWGHGVYFGKVVPVIGGCCRSVGLPLPPPVGRLPARAGGADRHDRAAGFGDVERRPLSGGIAQLVTAIRRP